MHRHPLLAQNPALLALQQPLAEEPFSKMVLGLPAVVQGLALASAMVRIVVPLDPWYLIKLGTK